MTNNQERLSPEALRSLLRYEPETGKLFWRERPGDRQFNARFSGKEAMTARGGHGYRHGKIYGRTVSAHRVIWAINFGEWPDHIDHIDGDPINNRLSNLRNVSNTLNRRNQSMQLNNTSGAVGVIQLKPSGKWRAYVGRTNLGHFDNREDAVAARAVAAEQLGYTARHGSVPPSRVAG